MWDVVEKAGKSTGLPRPGPGESGEQLPAAIRDAEHQVRRAERQDLGAGDPDHQLRTTGWLAWRTESVLSQETGFLGSSPAADRPTAAPARLGWSPSTAPAVLQVPRSFRLITWQDAVGTLFIDGQTEAK